MLIWIGSGVFSVNGGYVVEDSDNAAIDAMIIRCLISVALLAIAVFGAKLS